MGQHSSPKFLHNNNENLLTEAKGKKLCVNHPRISKELRRPQLLKLERTNYLDDICNNMCKSGIGKIKTTMSILNVDFKQYHLKKANVCEDEKKRNVPLCCFKSVQPSWEQYLHKNTNRITYHRVLYPNSIYIQKICQSASMINTPTFIGVLFVITNTKSQTKCSSVDEIVVCYICSQLTIINIKRKIKYSHIVYHSGAWGDIM